MTAYAVQADLEQRFGIDEVRLASDRNRTGELDVSIVTLALNDATKEIDSYLTERYDLPFTTVPDILERICCDVAMYRMSADAGTGTDEKRKRFEDAVVWLNGVAKGLIGLGLDSDDTTSIDEAQISSDSEVRLFTRTNLKGLM